MNHQIEKMVQIADYINIIDQMFEFLKLSTFWRSVVIEHFNEAKCSIWSSFWPLPADEQKIVSDINL